MNTIESSTVYSVTEYLKGVTREEIGDITEDITEEQIEEKAKEKKMKKSCAMVTDDEWALFTYFKGCTSEEIGDPRYTPRITQSHNKQLRHDDDEDEEESYGDKQGRKIEACNACATQEEKEILRVRVEKWEHFLKEKAEEKRIKTLQNFANISFAEKLYNTAHVCGNN